MRELPARARHIAEAELRVSFGEMTRREDLRAKVLRPEGAQRQLQEDQEHSSSGRDDHAVSQPAASCDAPVRWHGLGDSHKRPQPFSWLGEDTKTNISRLRASKDSHDTRPALILDLFVLLFKPATQFIQDGRENERHLTTRVKRRHLDRLASRTRFATRRWP